MTLAKQAAKLLAGLGDTPEEIRAMLVGAGYKGVRFSPTSCPCGACLRDHLGEHISIGNNSADHCGSRSWLSEPVADFTLNFDAGLYPELISE
jgi:hypothetical protein